MPFTKEQMKDYREANKEKLKESAKKYKEANKEKYKEYQKNITEYQLGNLGVLYQMILMLYIINILIQMNVNYAAHV
jgi:uncharacterized membrane protein